MNTVIFGRSYQDGYSYYNLGNDQWFHNFYVYNNPDFTAGVVNIDNHSFDTNIYTSPYPNLQKRTANHQQRRDGPGNKRADQQRQRDQNHLIQEGAFCHAPHHRQFTVSPYPTHLLGVKR